MGIFGRFRKKHNGAPASSAGPESLHLMPSGKDSGVLSSGAAKGIDSIYAFLQYDYESRGYSDALTNPDESYRSDNIRLIQHDLMILIDRTATYYETLLRETDFHISSRSRAGLIDLVEELKIRKEVTSDHLVKVKQIKEEALKGEGATQRIVLSYQRGFMRGLYAISQSKLFNGNI
ncbi:MAG TPA: hypothetical protein VK207_02145 [Bacteroidales bacterium]|nr:hypothetical protein [Bacteroidales bacterium]